MNDRIKEIAAQAGFKVNWQHEDVQAIKMARFEKFVKLFLEESIKVMTKHDYHGEWLGEKLKQHFEVA